MAASVSVCIFVRTRTEQYVQIRKIAACLLRYYLQALEDILSPGLDSFTVCGFLCDECAIRAPAVKLPASGIHLNTRGIPVSCFYLHLNTHTPSVPVRVVVNGIQSASAFCQCVYVDSSLWGSSKEPFTENNDPGRLAF